MQTAVLEPEQVVSPTFELGGELVAVPCLEPQTTIREHVHCQYQLRLEKVLWSFTGCIDFNVVIDSHHECFFRVTRMQNLNDNEGMLSP